MTDNSPEPEDGKIREIRENRLLVADQQEQYFEMLTDVSDEELITTAGELHPVHEMEMQRRLKSAVFDLTTEVVASRESSERLTSQLDASIADLTGEIVTFRKSSDTAAAKLAHLTWVIIVLTVIIAGLTVALVILTLRGGQASPASARSHPAHSVTPSPSGKSATPTEGIRHAVTRRPGVATS